MTAPALVDALERIDSLATQIPSSTSFASASLAREILDYARQVRSIRVGTASTQQTDLMTALKASAKQPASGASGGSTSAASR